MLKIIVVILVGLFFVMSIISCCCIRVAATADARMEELFWKEVEER